MMKKQKKSKGYIVGCVALSVLLALSTYFSLIVLGVITEDKKLNGSVEQTQSVEEVYVDVVDQQGVNSNVISNGTQIVGNNNSSSIQGSSQSNTVAGNSSQTGDSGNNNSNVGSQAVQGTNPLLNPNKTKADIVKIYADVMNNAKAKRPGFKKIEYQEFPGGEDRVLDEGSEKVTEEHINTLFDFCEDLGVFVSKEKGLENPIIHEKGDEDMSQFPVYNKSKGSYLSDPNGIKTFTYEILSDGNVKLWFMLVDEENPEPVPEDSEIPLSYTGAVFSPLSKFKIDRTINHPIITVFATDITYNLSYHDCYVEMIFNPETLQIVELKQMAQVTIKGAGNVVGLGRVGLAKQELYGTVHIMDFAY